MWRMFETFLSIQGKLLPGNLSWPPPRSLPLAQILTKTLTLTQGGIFWWQSTGGAIFRSRFRKLHIFAVKKNFFFNFDAFKTLLKWRNFIHKNSYLTLWKLNSCRNQENLPKHIIGKHLSCVSILVFGLFQLLLKSLDIFGRKN